jgi:hypothetical protein
MASANRGAFDLLRDALYSALLARRDAGGEALPYDFRADFYRAANAAGDEQVMRLLRSSSPMEQADAALRLPKEVEDIPLRRVGASYPGCLQDPPQSVRALETSAGEGGQ